MVIDEVGIAEIKLVLSQVRFALGFIPFIHGAILFRNATGRLESPSSIRCFYDEGRTTEPMPERHVNLTEGKTGTAIGAAWPEVVGFVLAGGESRRMGEDKALVPFAGRTLVEQAVETLRVAGLDVRIAGARMPLERFAPIVHDGVPGLGPLGGICAALHAITARLAVFLPVDLPLVPASLIEMLLRHAEITGRAVTVPSINGFVQTFPAVIDRRALPVLLGELEAGRGGCFAGFRAAAASLGESVAVIPVELVIQVGQLKHPSGLSAGRWFLNVNSRSELKQAEASLLRVS